MSNSQRRHTVLKFIVLSGIAGGGLYLFKKRADKIKYYKSIDKDDFLNEVSEILIANSKYTYELLTIDAPSIKRKEVGDVLDLESIQSLYDFYVASKSFKYSETRDFTKKLFLYNIKVIERFLNNTDDYDLEITKYSMAQDLKNIIKIANFYDLESEIEDNHELQYIAKKEEDCIIEKLSKGCLFTKFIVEQNSFF